MFRALSVFAGGFALAAAAAVCCGGDQAAALDLVDRLAGKSLVVAEPAAGGTRYRLLETIRQYAAEPAGRGRRGRAGPAAARRGVPARWRSGNASWRFCCASRTTSAPPWTTPWPRGGETGPRLARALGGFWLARGLFQEGRGWLERALAADPADPRLRADLLRLLGTVLYAAGDLERAQATLAQGSAGRRGGRAARRCRPGSGSCWPKSRLSKAAHYAEALEACEAAAAVLESEGDLEGLAEAWLSVGKLRFWGGDTLAAEQALERAAAYARQSGNHRAELESRAWLVATLLELPIPADVAVGRAEQLLEAAAGDPWAEAAILQPALAAVRLRWPVRRRPRGLPARPVHIHRVRGETRLGAMCARLAGRIELIAGDPAAAEQNLRRGIRGAPRDGRTRISRKRRHLARRGRSTRRGVLTRRCG